MINEDVSFAHFALLAHFDGCLDEAINKTVSLIRSVGP